MSGRKQASKNRSTNVTKSKKSGLIFPVGRVLRLLKSTGSTQLRRISPGAAVYTAAVLEYLTAEMMELSGETTKAHNRKLITARYIMFSVMSDSELKELLKNVTIPSSGVVPRIYPALLPKRSRNLPPAASQASPSPAGPVGGKQIRGRLARGVKKLTTPVPVTSARTVAKGGITSRARTPAVPSSVVVLSEKILSLGQKLTVVKASIVDVSADAVVHPTSSSYHPGQVGGKLLEKGGQLLRDEIAKVLAEKGPLDSADASITAAFNIPASCVIHCNSPSWNSSNASTAVANLEKCVRKCLQLAEDKNLRSIAFPSIGSGGCGFPKQTAAETIIRSINGYFAASMQSSIKQVYFVLYDNESINVYTHELARL